VVGDLLDLDSMHGAIAGCEAMHFGLSVSDTYLAATANDSGSGQTSRYEGPSSICRRRYSDELTSHR
jgi:hypothetical protein